MKFLTIILLFFTITVSAATPRYFLISYAYGQGTGSIGVFSNTYPKKTNVINLLRKTYNDPNMNIVVTNIVEFKAKADFDTFYSGSTYFDTVITLKATTNVDLPPSTEERTWFFKDLGINPNTGQCLTDKVQKAIDSALALGGTTNLIITESGTYNFSNSEQISTDRANVLIDVGCYPDGKGVVNEIVVDKCK